MTAIGFLFVVCAIVIFFFANEKWPSNPPKWLVIGTVTMFGCGFTLLVCGTAAFLWKHMP